MRRVQLAFALPLLALLAAPAEAKQVGIEGGEVVARFDPGDSGRSFTVRVDRAAGTIVARDGGGAPGGATVRAGAGCSNDPPPFGGGTVTCPLAGVTGIRLEAGAGDLGDEPRFGARTEVTADTLAVGVHGGPAADAVGITSTGSVTADLGAGDDAFEARAPSGTVSGGDGDDQVVAIGRGGTWTLDGGPGNDHLGSGWGRDTLTGGPGDDTLFAWANDGSRDTRQVLDCGEGDDRAVVDPLDALGAGCGPAVKGVRDGMTLGRFSSQGRLAMKTGRATGAVRVGYQVVGPEPPAFRRSGPSAVYGKKTVRVAAGRAIAVKLKPAAKLRKALGKRRKALSAAVFLEVRRRSGGDVTAINFSGPLKAARR